ncbi:MAG: hypothetical protein IT581_08950 [Verrucomicrobiales bacterium]|nr:hypothetical protein [Verrucomicrobiales bacterium]
MHLLPQPNERLTNVPALSSLPGHRMPFALQTLLGILVLVCIPIVGRAQVDPMHRSLLQIGYDQPMNGRGPQAVYAYYYYNRPDIAGTNVALRLAIAPAYLDGELGFKELLSPNTDLGVGIYGGAFADNYYDVRQGNYRLGESFDGHGGGAALSIYHLLNPGQLVPLNLMARAGFRYSTYSSTSDTDDAFEVPDDRPMVFARAGIRLAGKEPILDPDLGVELSLWYESRWHWNDQPYGFDGDRSISDHTELFWLYAGANYSWTNIGHRVSFAMTAGGSSGTDRLSAWRLGGVLPLVAEFPLILPGYYYQELTASRFVHFYASYQIPLDSQQRLLLRLEAATANVEYLPGYEQPDNWQSGVGAGLTFTPRNKAFRVIARYGYGFNALRNDGEQGGHSVGLLMQYDFDQGPQWWRRRR